MSRPIGIVRVSQTRRREGESFHSPKTQRQRLQSMGVADADILEELDVSGTKPLAKRPGLRRAVEMVEAGEADEIVVAYFDRLVRSVKVQAEIVERVERAGGNVLTLDAGQITNGKAATKLQANILGAIAQYVADQGREKSAEAQTRAVSIGIPPWPHVTTGYQRGEDGRFVPSDLAPVVAKGFEMRANGSTIREVRSLLAAEGARLSYHAVRKLLSSRVVLGEINFGGLVNTSAHKPIIDRITWQRAQRASVPAGRRGNQDRLLAKLGVLRCGTCEHPLSASTAKPGYPVYRCSYPDCEHRVTIGAKWIEKTVLARITDHLANMSTRVSSAENARDAVRTLESAQVALDVALRGFAEAGVTDEAIAISRLADLRAARDTAQARVDELGGAADERIYSAGEILERGDFSAKRALIKATGIRVVVSKGKGASRIKFSLE